MTLDEAIKRYTSNAFYEKSDGNLQGYLEFNQLAGWLKELKQLREQTRWIPVSERMPEEFQRVLVTIVNYKGNKVVRVAEYYNRKVKGVFQIKENHEEWEVGEKGLLAWMPLPTPYKGEREDEEMTTKEQILKCFKDIDHAYNDCTRYDTLKRMLDELQEPCEDCISRQAVLDSIHANCVYENEYNLTAKHIEDAVKQLPPVNPQKPICPSAGVDCEDCPAYEKKPNINEVLDKIRDEIRERSRMHMDGDLYIKTSDCMQIIDKYKAEGSEG